MHSSNCLKTTLGKVLLSVVRVGRERQRPQSMSCIISTPLVTAWAATSSRKRYLVLGLYWRLLVRFRGLAIIIIIISGIIIIRIIIIIIIIIIRVAVVVAVAGTSLWSGREGSLRIRYEVLGLPWRLLVRLWLWLTFYSCGCCYCCCSCRCCHSCCSSGCGL